MAAQTNNLYLLEDLDDASKTRQLAKSDLAALRTVADWIKTFVARPHKDLGRTGPVCPFVPGALERKALWLAPERIADLDVPAVVELMKGYKSLFLDAQPTDGDDANYKVIVVVFTDLPADRAQALFDDVLQQLAVPSYVEDGILFGPFYEGNKGTAIYNSGFRPFQSPVPFLFVRHGVIIAVARGGRPTPQQVSRTLPSFALGFPASDSTRTDASACLAQGQGPAGEKIDPTTLSPEVALAADPLLILMHFQNKGYALMSF